MQNMLHCNLYTDNTHTLTQSLASRLMQTVRVQRARERVQFVHKSKLVSFAIRICVWCMDVVCVATHFIGEHVWVMVEPQKRFLLLVRRLYYMNWNSVNAFCVANVHMHTAYSTYTHYLHCQPQNARIYRCMYWTQHILSIHMRDSSFLSRSKTTEHTHTHIVTENDRGKKKLKEKEMSKRQFDGDDIRVAV